MSVAEDTDLLRYAKLLLGITKMVLDTKEEILSSRRIESTKARLLMFTNQFCRNLV
jgi:hypothetical protein